MTLQLIQQENKCPDCICMDLKGIPVEQSRRRFRDFFTLAKRNSNRVERIKLLLSIQFNEQWESLPIGKIKFGLRRGELRLRLQGARIPLSARELGTPLIVSISTERKKQLESEENKGLEESLNGNKLGIIAKKNKKKSALISDTFQLSNGQISIKGNEQNPCWVFELKTGEPILKAILKDAPLGTLDVTSHPCSIKATFGVSLMKDIYVTDVQGLLSSEISKTQRIMLDRMLVKYFLKQKIGSYLSDTELIVLTSSQTSITPEVVYDS